MRQEAVYIVGGGPSLKGFDFNSLKFKDTITINKSIFDVPNPNYFITVDYTFLKKIKTQKIYFDSIDTTKIFIADFHFPYIKEKRGRIVDTRISLVYELQDFDLIIKSRQINGIGYEYKDFRTGGNSGYCALQLAVLLGYKKIYLLGIDLNKEAVTHYHGGYGEKSNVFNTRLPNYLGQFKQGLKQLKQDKIVEVYSCSKTSALNNIIDYVDINTLI